MQHQVATFFFYVTVKIRVNCRVLTKNGKDLQFFSFIFLVGILDNTVNTAVNLGAGQTSNFSCAEFNANGNSIVLHHLHLDSAHVNFDV